jgi:hypothetical protein
MVAMPGGSPRASGDGLGQDRLTGAGLAVERRCLASAKKALDEPILASSYIEIVIEDEKRQTRPLSQVDGGGATRRPEAQNHRWR